MPDQPHPSALPAGSGRTALRLVLMLSGFCLIAMRSVADAQTDLRVRIEQLQGEVSQARIAVAGRVALCRAPLQSASLLPARAVSLQREAGSALSAAQLMEEAPAGIDACARMESADAKVLGALSR